MVLQLSEDIQVSSNSYQHASSLHIWNTKPGLASFSNGKQFCGVLKKLGTHGYISNFPLMDEGNKKMNHKPIYCHYLKII